MDEKPATPAPTAARPKSRRRWCQYGLRTLLVGIVVLSLPCAYVGWQVKIVRERHDFWPLFNDHDYSVRVVGLWPADDAVDIPWIRKLMGDFPVRSLIYDPQQDKDGSQLHETRRLFPEANIWGWPNELHLPEGIKPIKQGRHIMI